MAVRKEYRDLTVGDIYRNGKSVPMLRVSGLWLEELGFKTGDFVRIKCEDGQLIISLNEEKAQQVAERKAEHPFCEKFYEHGVLVPVEEIHHKLPLSEGGTHDRSNLIALCKSCHSQIHAKRGDRWHDR